MAQGSLRPPYDVLFIGGSAGSLEVLLEIFPALQRQLQLAIVVVVHRKPGESLLTHLLSTKTAWPVKEAEDKEPIETGTVYLAPANYHLLVEKDRRLSLDASEKLHYSRPAIDVTFETGAEAYGEAAIALLLSGANADGAAGLQKIREGGGIAIVQDPATAAVPFMPEQAIKAGAADHVTATSRLVGLLNDLQGLR